MAENSGGAHCLKYGFTANHVTGVEFVTPSGEVVQIGGKAPDAPGYDLLGAVVGSEGTLGIATQVTVRLTRSPEDVRTCWRPSRTPTRLVRPSRRSSGRGWSRRPSR